MGEPGAEDLDQDIGSGDRDGEKISLREEQDDRFFRQGEAGA